ncbi:SpoIIE family protein phosphatase [Candidatus Peregrinibacteria bacterium]|nr:SpoIIE family protein phosphatase [Candidatus Peregrinibacteria bacterium]
MRFIQKSIIRKLLLYFTSLLLLLAGVAVYFYYSGNVVILPLKVVLIILGIFLFIALFIYYFEIFKPLKSILFQMQALLTGKPYQRIYTDRIDEIGVLAYFFNQVTKGFKEVSSDLKDRERMIDELTIAAELQRGILMKENPIVQGLQIVAKNKPATEVGGDSFSIITVKDKTYIYVGDVTGHGVSAGLIMTMVNSLINVFADVYDSAFDIVVNVNKYIKRHVKKAMFMTMVMLAFDHKTQKMTYVGAGHEHIIVYRAASGECEAILSGGIALGMVPDNSKAIKEKEIYLDDGDFVVLYTDGLTEARNTEGEMYSLDRLKASVKEYAAQYSAEGVNYHVAQDVSGFMSKDKQEDDMTLIVIKRDSKNNEEIKDHSTAWNG